MGPIAWFTQVPLLASMPRLSAALIQGGQSAAAGAAGAAGVVAVAAVPAAATTHVHQGAHHHSPPAVEQTTSGSVDPLSAVLALTGHRSLSTATSPSHVHKGKSAASVHNKRSGHASEKGLEHGQGPGGQSGKGSSKSNHGRHNSASKRHHGKSHKATTPTLTSSSVTVGRCGGNNGSGVGNGGGTTTNTHSNVTQSSGPLPPGQTRCE
jgi:hypothetical protein